MAINYSQLRSDVADLIQDFGIVASVTHLSGASSRGNIVFSSTGNTDVSIPDPGTVRGTDRVAFLNDVRNEIQVGDTITADGVTYRVREASKYKPATINCGYRVVLDT